MDTKKTDARPKVVVIGAGSYFFGRPVIWNMVKSKVLRNGTLALVDTDPHVLDVMMKMAKQAIGAEKAPTKLMGSTDRRELLKDADFVVLTFSNRNAHYRGIDTKISAKYGVKMCSSDTIGPGGIFRALREVPIALAITKDVQELAPKAWVINFVNPTSVLGIALMRYSDLNSFAICDGHHEPYHRLKMLKSVGIVPEEALSVPSEVEQRLDLAIAGVNHFTWLLRFGYDGKDYMPVWREVVANKAAEEQELLYNTDDPTANTRSKRKFNNTYALKLFDLFGIYPDTIGHTKEYVSYFQGYGVSDVDPEPIALFDAEERQKRMDAKWFENEEYAAGRKPISDFLDKGKGDHATDIIESMWGSLGKSFYINSANRGAVTNMPDDAFLELRCDLDMHGPRPQPVGEMPRGVLGLQHQVIDTHELTARAAVEFDRDVVLRAMAVDPIVNNLVDAKKIMEDLLEAEKEQLSDKWY